MEVRHKLVLLSAALAIAVSTFFVGCDNRQKEIGAPLSGFANNQAQIDRAVEIVRTVDGVNSVENKMSVKK